MTPIPLLHDISNNFFLNFILYEKLTSFYEESEKSLFLFTILKKCDILILAEMPVSLFLYIMCHLRVVNLSNRAVLPEVMNGYVNVV